MELESLRSVFDLETIPIFHPHYHTHSGNTSRPVNLAVLRWLVSYEDKNEYMVMIMGIAKNCLVSDHAELN